VEQAGKPVIEKLPITDYRLPITDRPSGSHFSEKCYICVIVVWANAFDAKAVPIANYAIHNFKLV
jgi:hypothetical protein